MMKKIIFSLNDKNKKTVFLFFLLISMAGFFCLASVPAQATHVDKFECTPTGVDPANATPCPNALGCVVTTWECRDDEYAYQLAHGQPYCLGVNVCSNEKIVVPTCTSTAVGSGLFICNSGFIYTVNPATGVAYCAPATPTVALTSLTPLPITYNTAATLRWVTTSASSCWLSGGGLDGWILNTGGTLSTGNLTANTTYSAQCWNSAGTPSTVSSVTVTVNACVPTFSEYYCTQSLPTCAECGDRISGTVTCSARNSCTNAFDLRNVSECTNNGVSNCSTPSVKCDACPVNEGWKEVAP